MKCKCAKIRVVDFVIIIGVVLALVVGFLTYKHFRSTASNQIESTSKIAFQVFLRGVTITGKENPIRANEDTFISIRNVPYTALKVVDVKADSKKIVMPSSGNAKQPYALVDDYGQAFMYDIVVTVEDIAKITKDGAVVGGNKIKIGLPITLEGKDYKFNGTVSNVAVLTPATVPTSAKVQGLGATKGPQSQSAPQQVLAEGRPGPIAIPTSAPSSAPVAEKTK
jgi:hypothetical protein